MQEMREDLQYRQAMFAEARELIADGEFDAAAVILRWLILATGGFVTIGEDIGKNSKSVMQMLSPGSNPTVRNFFSIVRSVQRQVNAVA
ncbi:hypothetical protein N5923_16160 [Erwiniaceae bacterium BAC15a-03b]|uniref:Uncharacterized protein n=1 Tax=Winslowiella arboricola TaxID=2978220 RepID=A0A9J6PW10_9GAMM|nr:hypothetical protein [Winslowiella arboricola]MCU5772498.1 hypothetical protein [Winslowiella arboricola]MCU5779020.1 hypothetical protein [Winslowiella arboricola]